MPKPALFTPSEISALASRLREFWRPGSQITPWLRYHVELLTRLHREERFSWAAVAGALNEAGIMFRTGNPWTASNLAKAVSEVRPGGRGNPSPERRAELAAWKHPQNRGPRERGIRIKAPGTQPRLHSAKLLQPRRLSGFYRQVTMC